MRKRLSVVGIILLGAILLASCGKEAPTLQKPPALRFVTQVDVTCRKGEAALRWQYTHEEKMQAVLMYLRGLDPKGTAQVDPARVEGDHFEIILQYSDGDRRIYYQHADSYLSDNYKPWEQINPVQGKKLYPLLQSMPSDIL